MNPPSRVSWSAMTSGSYSVVFGGGGCRTFWGVGVLESLGLAPPQESAGVSAGAAMATIMASGRAQHALERFVWAVQHNRRNVYPLNAVLAQRRVFPHDRMYRQALYDALGAGGWDNVRRSGPIRVFMAFVKPGAPFRRSVLRALGGYRKRSRLRLMHGLEEPPAGLGTETVTVQNAASIEQVVELILASSATWPITPLPRRGGRTYIDGGAIDGLPVRALSPEARLGKVLLLRTDPLRAEERPGTANRLYLSPDRPLPVSIWDYAHHERVLATYERGRRDGARLRGLVGEFLAAPVVSPG